MSDEKVHLLNDTQTVTDASPSFMSMKSGAYKSYKRRYWVSAYQYRFYMLGVYCLLNGLNGLMWVSMSPIASTVKQAYEVGDFQINLIANLYLILFLPGMFLASYAFDRLGLRYGLIIGATMQGVGAILKYFLNYGFWIVFVGQGFWAVAQPLFIASPALVATHWFNNKERTIAITIGGTSNMIGNAVGFFFPTIFVDANNDTNMDLARKQIATALLVQGIIGLVLILLVVATFQDKPKIPPASNAIVPRERNLLGTYYQLVRNVEFIKLTICFTSFNNIIIVVLTLIDKFSQRYNFDTDDSGFFGTMIMVGGITGSFLFGAWLAKSKRYKTAIVGIGILTTVSVITLMFWFRTQNEIIVAFASAFLGFSSFPTLIVWYDFWSKVTFPLNEATVGGLFQLPTQYVGFVNTIIWTSILNAWEGDKGVVWTFIFLIFWAIVGTTSAITVKKLTPKLLDRNERMSQVFEEPRFL